MKNNKICFNPKCQKEYYCCMNCGNDIFSWRRVACCPECFQEYMDWMNPKDEPEVAKATIKITEVKSKKENYLKGE